MSKPQENSEPSAPASGAGRLRRVLLFAGPAALVLALDQATKFWALRALAPAHPFASRQPPVHLIPGFLRLEYAENTGAAFSLFREHPGALALVASVLAAAVLVWNLLLPERERLTRVALALIFGGAVGNLIDRFRFGFVVDFIVAYWDKWAWPTFNIADSAICVGIGLFVLATLLETRAEKTKRHADSSSPKTSPAPDR